MITEADIVVQAVLLVLVGMSIGCWVIIFNKVGRLRRAVRLDAAFLDTFWKSQRLDQVFDRLDRFTGSPVAAVFRAAYVELSRLTRDGEDGSRGVGSIALGAEENLERTLRRAMSIERTALERMTPFLATTGSTAPFIGLFGTVWGILRAFQKIDATGQATVATVGGDISHALIATAVGLLAAIPAVMAYNYVNSRIRVLSTDMENFSSDFLNIVKRHFQAR
ncbi:MAG: Tol-Pal system subunit TolQ [Deltaproteobacteria bacterium]|nr:MAG: Tol-Pal system subunit TolQ [Deltaproteobacteria bacterium]